MDTYRYYNDSNFWLIKFKRNKGGMVSLYVLSLYLLGAIGVWMEWWGRHWDKIFNPDGYGVISFKHWFGTNFNGQDIFQRTLYSLKTAFELGMSVAVITVMLGTFLGLIAGFHHKNTMDKLIVWLYGCLDLIPFYLLIGVISFVIQAYKLAMFVAMLTVMWTNTCKVVRAQVSSLRVQNFVKAARAIGAKDSRILFIYLLPNVLPTVLVEISVNFVTAIKTEVLLSFLGFGTLDGVSWGSMLAEASNEITGGHYHNFIFSTLFMCGLIFSVNQLTDALSEAIAPSVG
jgi:peptide/nickel transport system permease protein